MNYSIVSDRESRCGRCRLVMSSETRKDTRLSGIAVKDTVVGPVRLRSGFTNSRLILDAWNGEVDGSWGWK